MRWFHATALIALTVLAGAATALALPKATDGGKAQQWLYSCSGAVPYGLAIFDGPAGAELADTPEAAALRREIERSGEPEYPDRGWRLAGRTETRATFVNGKPGPGGLITEVTFAPNERGRWKFSTSAHFCRPGPFVEGRGVPSWKLDRKGHRHRRGTRRIHALTRGSFCSSGRPPRKRLRRPMVSYGERRIVIAPIEVPPEGSQTCQGNPAIEVVFRLREPIGDRAVVDGSSFPFRKRLDARFAR